MRTDQGGDVIEPSTSISPAQQNLKERRKSYRSVVSKGGQSPSPKLQGLTDAFSVAVLQARCEVDNPVKLKIPI
jgi:hypothetical protein